MGEWSGLHCERVTVYTYAGEDAEGRAEYQPARFDGVTCFRRGGVRSGDGMDAYGDDTALVYLFRDAMGRSGKRYVEPEAYDALDAAGRQLAFTVHTDGRDLLCMGAQYGSRPPEGVRTMRITGVGTRDQGSKWLHHLKIHCPQAGPSWLCLFS